MKGESKSMSAVTELTRPSAHRDKRELLKIALEEFRARLDAGEDVQRESFLHKYAIVADELAECFVSLDFVRHIAPQLADEELKTPEESSTIQLKANLGDFRIVCEIGRGGMGVVYKAEQLSLGRKVALKVLPFASVLDGRQLQRFKNEAHAAATLHHTNIVPVFGTGCERGVHYYAMQYIEGQTLAEVIHDMRRREGLAEGPDGDGDADHLGVTASEMSVKFAESRDSGDAPSDYARAQTHDFVDGSSPATSETQSEVQAAISTKRSSKSPGYYRGIAELGIQAAEALEHAHGEGVIHRDIKPSNLILDGRGKVWVTDFGLAHVESDAALTMTGDLIGTLRYMSPEQALAKRVVVDERTDVYSLGVTLYELLTLEPAYSGNDRQELLRKIAFEEPRPPRRHSRLIPAELETVVLKSIAKNPGERYATAQELAEDLERFVEDKPITARRPNLLQRAAKWSRRHKPLVWSVTAAAAIVLITVAAALAVVANRERLVRVEAEGQLAESYLHRARQLCEEGDVALGMLWLARSLQRSPVEATELQRVIRRNLAAWSRQLHPLAAIVEPGVGPWPRHLGLTFSPNDSCLLIASGDGAAQLWDPATGIPIGPPLQHEDFVESFRMSADGSRVLTGSWDWTARLWDAATGKPIGKPLRHEDKVGVVRFSPDELRILTGSRDGIARVWDADTGKLRASTQQKHKHWVSAAAFSPDGSKILTGSIDGTARLWLAATGEPISEPLACKNAVSAVNFSPDGSRLQTVSLDGSTRLWEAETGKLIEQRPFHYSQWAHSAAVSRDGSRYLLGSAGRTARLWEVAKGKALRQPLRHSSGRIGSVAFSPDESGFATASGSTVRLWGPSMGYALGPPLKHGDGRGGVNAVAFSADASRLLTGDDSSAQLWDAATGKPLSEPLKVGMVLAFSGDGARLIARPDKKAQRGSNTVQVWDVATGTALGEPLPQMYRSLTGGAALSADGLRALIGPYLFDAGTGLRERILLHPPGSHLIRSVAFSPEGSRLVTAEETTVRLWEAATGKPVGEPLEHQDQVWAVAFNPDGSQIMTGLVDGTAWVWDLSTGKPIHGPLEHEADVQAVAFSPDGAILLTGSLDATARFWDAATGKPIGPPLRHDVGVKAVAFSPDGSRILTGSLDGTARLWQAPPLPVKGKLDQTVLWTQVITGLELDESSVAVHVLDRSSWHLSRDLLEKLGGPPPGALETVRPTSHPSSHDPLTWHRLMAHHRAQEKQWPEVVRHRDAILNAPPQNWWDLIARGRAYAELGQWQKAAADYAKATRLAPHNWTVWRRYAETRLAADDLAGYRETCRTLLVRFGQTKGLMAARGIASTCALAPKSVDDFQQPLELAQKALDYRGERTHGRAVLGGMLYRTGRFVEAVEPLKEALAPNGRSDKYPSAYSSFFLAMAYQQLGDTKEARECFEQALQWTKQFTQQAHPDPWHTLALQLLRREAESLLEDES